MIEKEKRVMFLSDEEFKEANEIARKVAHLMSEIDAAPTTGCAALLFLVAFQMESNPKESRDDAIHAAMSILTGDYVVADPNELLNMLDKGGIH